MKENDNDHDSKEMMMVMIIKRKVMPKENLSRYDDDEKQFKN